MALIKCSRCNQPISDKSTHCVHCGITVSDSNSGMEIPKNSESEEYILKKSLVGSLKNKPAEKFPTSLLLLSYITFIVAFLHIAFTNFVGTNMFPDSIVRALYSNGIFIRPQILSLLIAFFIITLSLITLKTKSKILRVISGIYYITLSIGSFQVFTWSSKVGLVWQFSIGGPRIPEAPFALMMAILPVLCLILLLLPQSSKHFSK